MDMDDMNEIIRRILKWALFKQGRTQTGTSLN